MASNSQVLDTSQDVAKKSDHESDSATPSPGNSQGAGENSDPKSGSPTSSPDNPRDEAPQDVENDVDADDPPANPFPLLRFIRPDNYLVRFVQEFDFDELARGFRYRYPRARG